jgi:hypothetical protein
MKITFIIRGNQGDQFGNPIPKIKKTYRQSWTPEVQRYVNWKAHVQKAFFDVIENKHTELLQRVEQSNVRNGKPIEIERNEKVRMDIKIWWKNEAHADGENVFGSIADALFKNDKKLDGSFENMGSSSKEGSVKVEITINQ